MAAPRGQPRPSVQGLQGGSDLGDLQDLSERVLVDVLFRRSAAGEVYFYVGDSLLFLNNTFQPAAQYEAEQAAQISTSRFYGFSTGAPTAHIFCFASEVYELAVLHDDAHCCMFTGENGSGKSMNKAQFLAHFLHLGCGPALTLEAQRLIRAPAVLSSFVSCQTADSKDSTRCLSSVTLHLHRETQENQPAFAGARLGLDLVQLTRLRPGQRSGSCFRVFYEMLVGMPRERLLSLGLRSSLSEDYAILRGQEVPEAKSLQDSYWAMMNALDVMGIDKEQTGMVFRVLAAILLLGNVQFEPSGNLTAVASVEEVQAAAAQLQVSPKELVECLTQDTLSLFGQVLPNNTPTHRAEMLRDKLIQGLYGGLVQWIVDRVNENLRPVQSNTKVVELIDSGGFGCNEQFNGFEQLCVNMMSESLVLNQIEHICIKPQKLCESEGIPWKHIPIDDNREIVELLVGSAGLFRMLDFCEHHQTLQTSIESGFRANPLLEVPDPRQPLFGIFHFNGKVSYDSTSFLADNHLALPTSVKSLLQRSPFQLLHTLCPYLPCAERKSKQLTVVKQHQDTIQGLFARLARSKHHFVQCLRANRKSEVGGFDEGAVREQLRGSCTVESATIARNGYHVCIPHDKFLATYGGHTDSVTSGTDRLCREVLCDTDPELWAVGPSFVFLKREAELSLRPLCDASFDRVPSVTFRQELYPRRPDLMQREASSDSSFGFGDMVDSPISTSFPHQQTPLSSAVSGEYCDVGGLMGGTIQLKSSQTAPLQPTTADRLLSLGLTPCQDLEGLFDTFQAAAAGCASLVQQADVVPLAKTATALSDPAAATLRSRALYEVEIKSRELKEASEEKVLNETIRLPRHRLSRNDFSPFYGRLQEALVMSRKEISRPEPPPRSPALNRRSVDSAGSDASNPPLEHFPWFHGTISRTVAEERLKSSEPGSFLVRSSESHKGVSLSTRLQTDIKHYMIGELDNCYHVVGKDQLFRSVPDLIQFFKSTPVSSKGCCLIFPCPRPDAVISHDADGNDDDDDEDTERVYVDLIEADEMNSEVMQEVERLTKEKLAQSSMAKPSNEPPKPPARRAYEGWDIQVTSFKPPVELNRRGSAGSNHSGRRGSNGSNRSNSPTMLPKQSQPPTDQQDSPPTLKVSVPPSNSVEATPTTPALVDQKTATLRAGATMRHSPPTNGEARASPTSDQPSPQLSEGRASTLRPTSKFGSAMLPSAGPATLLKGSLASLSSLPPVDFEQRATLEHQELQARMEEIKKRIEVEERILDAANRLASLPASNKKQKAMRRQSQEESHVTLQDLRQELRECEMELSRAEKTMTLASA